VDRLKTPGASRSFPLATVSDTELVSRCRNGDKAAWRLLFERHAPTVYRFLTALGVPPSDREDACQEVFLAIYKSLGRFRGESQLSTWIYRIAARGAGRAMERQRLRNVLAAVLLREPEAPLIDPSEQADRMRLFQKMLERLSPKKRLVFVLFEVEGIPIEEIADIVGCPANTAWSRLHHARREIAKMASKVEGGRSMPSSSIPSTWSASP